ncbi:MAG: recombinase family protein [Clostridia bacterium]|nr:recombinase family protein [Clostridia bacterium]
MIKVAIYCRLSDEDKEKVNILNESESIQNQKNLLTMYALERGWDIYKIYCDEDYSGLDKDRPDFNAMIRDAGTKKFNVILCKSQSRFTRDMELVEKYLHNKFIEWGIRFIGIADNADTFERGNKKSRQINGLVNEWYCEDVSENIRLVFDNKRKSGKFIGSFATYGYSKDPFDKNKLVVDEEAAHVVRMIFKWYLEGYGTQHIAYMLNEHGMPNPTKYKQEKGMKFKNSSKTDSYGLWNKTTVKRILKNEMYIGNMVQSIRKKVSYKSKRMIVLPKNEWIVVKNTHEPIIEKQVFIQVQNRMNSNMRSTGEGQAHLFATKIKCMDCKSTMHKVKSSNGMVYLRCKLYTVDPKKNLCTSHSIRMDKLIEIVSGKVKYYIESYTKEENLISKLRFEEGLKDKVSQMKLEIEKIKVDIEDKSQIIKGLYIDKVKGVLEEGQFIELNRSFSTDKENLLNRKSKIEEEIKRLEVQSDSFENLINIVNKYRDFKELTRMMINELIGSIEVGERDKETGEQKIKIHWLF